MKDSQGKYSIFWLLGILLCLAVSPFVLGGLQTFGWNDRESLSHLFLWTLTLLSCIALFLRSVLLANLLGRTTHYLLLLSFLFIMPILYFREGPFEFNTPYEVMKFLFFAVFTIGTVAFVFETIRQSRQQRMGFTEAMEKGLRLYGVPTPEPLITLYLPIHIRFRWPIAVIGLIALALRMVER